MMGLPVSVVEEAGELSLEEAGARVVEEEGAFPVRRTQPADKFSPGEFDHGF
jgi:hypothetical protein